MLFNYGTHVFEELCYIINDIIGLNASEHDIALVGSVILIIIAGKLIKLIFADYAKTKKELKKLDKEEKIEKIDELLKEEQAYI